MVQFAYSSKGFNFITPDELFIHELAIGAEGFRTLVENEKVNYGDYNVTAFCRVPRGRDSSPASWLLPATPVLLVPPFSRGGVPSCSVEALAAE